MLIVHKYLKKLTLKSEIIHKNYIKDNKLSEMCSWMGLKMNILFTKIQIW